MGLPNYNIEQFPIEKLDILHTVGSRWGIRNEKTIRHALSKLFKKSGYKLTKGYYGNKEIDVIVKNDEHILLTITTSATKNDIRNLNKSAEDYQTKVGVEPRLMIASVNIPHTVAREIKESFRKIDILAGYE